MEASIFNGNLRAEVERKANNFRYNFHLRIHNCKYAAVENLQCKYTRSRKLLCYVTNIFVSELILSHKT